MEPRLKASGHSSLEMVFLGGDVEFVTNMACYSMVWAGRPNMEQLYVWFPEHKCKLIAEYVNWVLNSDLFGEAFITKDFEIGMVDGFEVNIDMPTNFLFSAMAALRFPWEQDLYRYDGWHYAKFREMGFTPKQCLFLLTGCYIDDEGMICPSGYNSNHLPIPRSTGFANYKPECFTRQEGSMREQYRSIGVTDQWVYTNDSVIRNLVKFKENGWGGAEPIKLTDKIIEKLKEALKED